jgi:hypothetical protein
MLGRKAYTPEELQTARTAIAEQLDAYRRLTAAVAGDADAEAALATFEPRFFNNLTLALDRYFVHRIRPVTGKDGNPLAGSPKRSRRPSRAAAGRGRARSAALQRR